MNTDSKTGDTNLTCAVTKGHFHHSSRCQRLHCNAMRKDTKAQELAQNSAKLQNYYHT